MRLSFLFPVLALAACATADPQGPAEADLAAVRQVTMSGPSLSWQEMRVHPALQRSACAVSTLVNTEGQVVGYCQGGRQCRTMDWRPIEPGCIRPPRISRRAGQHAAGGAAMAPSDAAGTGDRSRPDALRLQPLASGMWPSVPSYFSCA